VRPKKSGERNTFNPWQKGIRTILNFLTMNWYLVKMVFSASTDSDYQAPEFDIQMRLINSRNQEEALMQSLVIGREEEKLFLSEIGEVVRWSFVDVAELTMLPGLQDDLQLFAEPAKEEKRQPWYSYFFLILQIFF
jgi:hypothetical protein